MNLYFVKTWYLQNDWYLGTGRGGSMACIDGICRYDLLNPYGMRPIKNVKLMMKFLGFYHDHMLVIESYVAFYVYQSLSEKKKRYS